MTGPLYREIGRLNAGSTPLRLRIAVLPNGVHDVAAILARLGDAAELQSIGPGRIEADVLALLGKAGCALGLAGMAALLPRVEGVRLCVVDLKLAPSKRVLRALAELSEIAAAAGLSMTHWREGPVHGAMRVFLQRKTAEPDPVLALALDAFDQADRAMTALTAHAPSEAVHGAYARAARIEGWGATAPVRDAMGAAASDRGWSRERNRILVSIHIQSNSPDNLRKFFARVGNSCDDPSRIEVIVKIDDDHVALNEMLPREVARQPFQLKYISTPLVGGFFELWRSMNDMLAITDPSAYFLLNLNDEMVFLDRGWDTRLARYVGLFPDDLFRLRTSIYRSRNYHDHWECGFAPETSAVTTKKWIETGGNWNPCLGPDTFQQCVAFYFNRLNWRLDKPQQREIPVEDIRFGGEGAYVGLTGESLRRRVRGATKAWFRLMSEEIQTEAAKRAAKIHAAIAAHRRGLSSGAIEIDEAKRVVTLRAADGGAAERIAYGAAPHWYAAVNARRALQFGAFGGGGVGSFRSWPYSIAAFLALRYDWAERLRTAAMSADARNLGPALRLFQPFLRIPYYIMHAPDHLDLFYRRQVRHGLNLIELLMRRGAVRTRNAIWWLLVGGPRRGLAHLDLAARRGGGSVMGHVAGFVFACARLAKRAAWWLLIGGPRWLAGYAALAYHVSARWLAGHADLAARRTWGILKRAAWSVLIAAPRWVGSHVALAAVKAWRFVAGHADLAARRTAGAQVAWRLLISAPNWVAGHVDLTARRLVCALKVAAWHVFVAAPRALAGHVDLALRRGFGALKVAAWQVLVGAPRGLAGHVDLALRRGFGALKVAAWQVLVGAPRRLAAWLSGKPKRTESPVTPSANTSERSRERSTPVSS